jgi:hypothetical protein
MMVRYARRFDPAEGSFLLVLIYRPPAALNLGNLGAGGVHLLPRRG